MDQLIPSLVVPVEPFAVAFRKEAFDMFRLMVGAWVVCLGRRTISRVWGCGGVTRNKGRRTAGKHPPMVQTRAGGGPPLRAGVPAPKIRGTREAPLRPPRTPERTPRRKKGSRLPTPAQILADDGRWPAEEMEIDFPQGKRRLLVKVVRDVCWYQAAGPQPVQLILVRDPQGQWRDEALLSTDLTLSPEEIITGYCRRWSVEVAFYDSKQMLGFHDPQVWCANSVQRAAPMSWFIGSLVALCYVFAGHACQQAQRHRPWYRNKPEPTFADMLATCRFHHWWHWLNPGRASRADMDLKWEWLLEHVATST